MLWSISTVSPPLHLRHCWLACLHLRQTFCQISRFILIAPLCQRLLMIFYHTLHSAFHRCLFCFRRRRALRRLRYWSNRPSSPRELVITQSVLKLSPFSERRKGLEVCFAPKKKKKKKVNCLRALPTWTHFAKELMQTTRFSGALGNYSEKGFWTWAKANWTG